MTLDPAIDALLMSGLPATAVTTIRRRLAYLATLFSDDEPKSGTQGTWLGVGNLRQLLCDAASGAEPQRPDWMVLAAIGDEAKAKGSKSHFPFLAALLATRRGDDPLNQRHDAAVALCIAGGLHTAYLWGATDPSTAKAVTEAARAVRQLATTVFSEVLLSLPSLAREPRLLQALLGNDERKALLYENSLGEPDIANWLATRQHSEPRKLLCALVGKLKFGRKAITAPNRGSGSHKTRTRPSLGDFDASVNSKLIPRSPLPSGPSAFVAPKETEDELDLFVRQDSGRNREADDYNDDTRPRVESPSQTRKHLKTNSVNLNRTYATSMARDMARRALHLPCESAPATPEEAVQFSTLLFDRLTKLETKDAHYEGLLYAGLSLVLGRSPSELSLSYSKTGTLRRGLVENHANDWTYQRGITLPNLVYSPGVAKLLRATPERILPLPLPLVLSRGLAAFVRMAKQGNGLDLVDHDDLARCALKSLSPDLKRTWTLSRVCGVLPAALHQMGADRAHAAWILGERPMDAPPTHYSQLDRYGVVETFKRASRHICGFREQNALTFEPTLGSPIILTDRAISAFLNGLRAVIKNADINSTRQFPARHNQIAILTYVVLALATGHRPVRSPFERVHDFDLESGWVIINDKAFGSASSRLVPIGPIATSYLTGWLDHLRDLALSQGQARPLIAQRAYQALNNARPLLFLLEDDAPVQFTPSAMQEILRPTLPLPANWTRHAASTVLRQSGLNPDLIDACIGHDGLHVGHQSRSSPLSHAQMRAFADAIENWFVTLGLGSTKDG